MATKIGDAKPVKREITMQGTECVVEFSEDGVEIIRKGDRHRDKRSLNIDWDELMDVCSPDDHAAAEEDSYTPTGYLDYEGE